jgi:hypothetical protein
VLEANLKHLAVYMQSSCWGEPKRCNEILTACHPTSAIPAWCRLSVCCWVSIFRLHSRLQHGSRERADVALGLQTQLDYRHWAEKGLLMWRWQRVPKIMNFALRPSTKHWQSIGTPILSRASRKRTWAVGVLWFSNSRHRARERSLPEKIVVFIPITGLVFWCAM